MDRVQALLQNKGFKVFQKIVKHKTLIGSDSLENRIIAYRENAKFSISVNKSNGGASLYITISGKKASSHLARIIENLGGKVDFEEGKRLFAVIRNVEEVEINGIIQKLLLAWNT